MKKNIATVILTFALYGLSLYALGYYGAWLLYQPVQEIELPDIHLERE